MAQELNIEQKLADLLDTRDFYPETLGKDGRPADAAEAKTFTFDYVSGSRKNYGTMVIVLGNDNEMMIMYGDNLGKTMEDPDDRDEFFEFQQQLMQLAKRNRWDGTLMDINKLKRVQAGIAAIKEGLFEGYYGNRRTSYSGEPTEARLVINHNRVLGENDKRYRYVESLFIETADRERFKLPFTNLAGGRAMLEHVRQGGKPYDIRGCHINEMVTEMKVLGRFNRASQGRVMEGVTQEIAEQAQAYYQSLRESIKRMGTPRGYNSYFESWHPAEVSQSEDLVENIKTMFIEQTLDTRIEEALPLLARIQQQGNAMKEADIFESWINNLAEGTWNVPETKEQLLKLKELLAKDLIVGPDGTNAKEQLRPIVGDDILFDRIEKLAKNDAKANAWNDTEVMDRLRELGIDTTPQEPAGVEPGIQPEEPVAPTPDMPQEPEMAPVSENMIDEVDFDSLNQMASHAVNTLGHGGAGVAAATTGAAIGGLIGKGIEKTSNYFQKKKQDKAYDNLKQQQSVGECNYTMEGEYCPEHGLAECGGTVAGAMAPVMGENNDDPINSNSAITGAYYESKSDDALLARIKSLALIK